MDEVRADEDGATIEPAGTGEERLNKLRELATDERRYSQLLREAADQRALAQPGAREGLEDALTGDTVDL